MALIKCPECGKEISDKSMACVHCGFPLDEWKQEPTVTQESVCDNHSVSDIDVLKDNGVNPMQQQRKKKPLFFVVAVVAVLVAIFLIASITRKDSLIDGISLGMTMKAVSKAEGNIGTEFEGCYIVQNKDFYGKECSFVYAFNTDGKLNTINITPSGGNYKIFSHFFYTFYERYGTPDSITEDFESILPLQKIVWVLDNGVISLVYSGESGHSSRGTFVLYESSLTEDIDTTTVNFHGPQKCTAGSVVGGCDNEALPWSEYCEKSSCNIVGCGKYVFSDEIDDVSLCITHFSMAIKGTIYVGFIDPETEAYYHSIWFS